MARAFVEWIAKMNCRSPERVALANLLYDAGQRRVRRPLLKRLMRFIDLEWARHTDKSPDEMIRLFAQADPEQHYCQGLPEPQRPASLTCSRVMDAKTLWEKNIDLPTAGCLVDNDIDTKEIRRLERRGLRRLAINEMRSRAPFAWITKTDHLNALRGELGTSTFANSVRDHLALVSYFQRQKLVEVRYPADTVATMSMAPPTVIEGSPGGAFRSVKKKDGWGRTLHLQTRKQALPEAVHRPVSFTEDFTLFYIGRPDPVQVSFDRNKCSQSKINELLQILGETEESE